MLGATALLSSISSRSMSTGGDEFRIIVLEPSGAAQMWPMDRNVVPPILRTRSAISSVVARMSLGLFVQQAVVVAKVRPADMPMEVLGLEIERVGVRQHCVHGLRDIGHRFGGQIGRCVEGAAAPLARV